MNVGFVGLGLMGRPMALHLEKAGHSLHLWARRPESLAPFEGSKARKVLFQDETSLEQLLKNGL